MQVEPVVIYNNSRNYKGFIAESQLTKEELESTIVEIIKTL